MLESEADGPKLYQAIETLLADPSRLAQMGQKAKELAKTDASARIYREICQLTGQ